jgi:hypothetical protein
MNTNCTTAADAGRKLTFLASHLRFYLKQKSFLISRFRTRLAEHGAKGVGEITLLTSYQKSLVKLVDCFKSYEL